MQAGDEQSASVYDKASTSAAAHDSQDENDLSTDDLPAPETPQQIPVPEVPASAKKTPPLWLWAFMAITFTFRCLSEAVFSLVAFRFAPWKQWSLKDVSAAAVQSHLRLKQACSWPINYILVKQHWTTDLKKSLAVEIK